MSSTISANSFQDRVPLPTALQKADLKMPINLSNRLPLLWGSAEIESPRYIILNQVGMKLLFLLDLVHPIGSALECASVICMEHMRAIMSGYETFETCDKFTGF